MKIDIRQPPPQARTLEEGQAMVNELSSLVRELSHRIDVLEEKLRTDSHNSSTPPSADPHRRPAKKSRTGKKRGAQPDDMTPSPSERLLRPTTSCTIIFHRSRSRWMSVIVVS